VGRLSNVSAVIVAYYPDPDTLRRVAAAITPQVNGVLIVANDGGAWTFSLPQEVTLAKQAANIGLGAAYNLAAQWALSHGATHLLLLDQDSVPAPGMVEKLREAFKQPGAVAASGPLWRDSRTGEDGFFVRFARWGTRRYRPAIGEVVPVDFLISSGLLVALDALADIGPFDEKLFIEHVDSDWALRARAKGYRLYGIADARLDHAFGEATAWPLGLRRRVFVYPPERNYYLLRNSIVMWRRYYVPWRWVFHDLRRTGALMLIYAFCIPPRPQRLSAMFRAVRDGVKMR
jgi:rhamnosyltransferase